MKEVIGGYANLNLHDIDVSEQKTIPGIYDEVAQIVAETNKPIIVHELNFDGVTQQDTYVTKVVDNTTSFVISTGAYDITITVSDAVTAVEHQSGGGADIEFNPSWSDYYDNQENLNAINDNDNEKTYVIATPRLVAVVKNIFNGGPVQYCKCQIITDDDSALVQAVLEDSTQTENIPFLNAVYGWAAPAPFYAEIGTFMDADAATHLLIPQGANAKLIIQGTVNLNAGFNEYDVSGAIPCVACWTWESEGITYREYGNYIAQIWAKQENFNITVKIEIRRAFDIE